MRGRAARSSSGPDVVGDGMVMPGLVLGDGPGHGLPGGVAELVGLASGQDRPGPFDEFAGSSYLRWGDGESAADEEHA